MACACGKNRAAAVAAARGMTFVYDFTAPGAESPQTFSTPLEAKRAVRQAGGGTVRRRQVGTTA